MFPAIETALVDVFHETRIRRHDSDYKVSESGRSGEIVESVMIEKMRKLVVIFLKFLIFLKTRYSTQFSE